MIGIEENAPTAIVLQRVTKQTMAVQKLSIQFPLQIWQPYRNHIHTLGRQLVFQYSHILPLHKPLDLLVQHMRPLLHQSHILWCWVCMLPILYGILEPRTKKRSAIIRFEFLGIAALEKQYLIKKQSLQNGVVVAKLVQPSFEGWSWSQEAFSHKVHHLQNEVRYTKKVTTSVLQQVAISRCRNHCLCVQAVSIACKVTAFTYTVVFHKVILERWSC